MRRIAPGIGALLLAIVTACTAPAPPGAERTTASAPAGTPASLALRGQVEVAHSPGTQDVVAEVRRQAAARCPTGFIIRSLHTGTPTPGEITARLLPFEAVVDCTPPA